MEIYMEQVIQNLEKTLHDVLNAGLGAYGDATVRLDELKKQVEASYGELIARGAADKSEIVEKLRGGLDQGIASAGDFRTKVKGVFEKKSA